MPRRLRVSSGGYAYHVLNRGVGRLRLFGKPRDFEALEDGEKGEKGEKLPWGKGGAESGNCEVRLTLSLQQDFGQLATSGCIDSIAVDTIPGGYRGKVLL